MDSKSLCSILLILTVIKTARAQSSSPILFGGECNHYYDYPIDICFSVNSSLTGLRSYKYICNLNNTGYDDYNIRLNIYNGTNDCSSNNYGLNSTLIYNLTMNDLNGTEPYNKFISCRGEKSCPYFKGRWYITKILTESPTLDPTNQPSIDPTPTPSSNPTITNGTHNPTIYPSTSPSMEPTYTPIMPSFSPSMTNDTISPTISPSESTLNPSFAPTPTPTYEIGRAHV